MRHRLSLLVMLACAALLAVFAAGASSAAADTTQLTVIGPWQGQDAASFNAVLEGFTASHPGTSITYKPVSGDVAAALPGSDAGTSPFSRCRQIKTRWRPCTGTGRSSRSISRCPP